MIETTTRNAGLADLAHLLQQQHARKIDAVVPASQLNFVDGALQLADTGIQQIEAGGVTSVDGDYWPTAMFDEGVAAKLNIPLPYLRRLREGRSDLYDANVNGWLHGVDGGDPDPRSFLVRLFRGDTALTGIARAFLSNSYKPIDNLDVLTAAMSGIQETGLDVVVTGCDLTERRMQVRIAAPQIQALAKTLLKGYRSPFTGQTGEDNPVVFAGFAIGNSETGSGAFTITPRITVQVCANGLQITKDALREVHLGGRQDDGVIRWGDDTNQAAIELVTLRARDAVKTFLDIGYMERVIGELEAKAEHRVDPTTAINLVGKKLAFDAETTAGVFRHFLDSGQHTAGGVMAAVTSWAQMEGDPDKAQTLEAAALPALEFAATL